MNLTIVRLLVAELVSLLLLLPQIIYAQNNYSIAKEVKDPPGSAKPRTWWHWTNMLAGDQKAAPDKKILNFTPFICPGRGLNDSGLPGPVEILKY